MATGLLIRPWKLSDSPTLGRILAQGWQQAYAGFMSKEQLGLRVDPDHRATEIEQWLSMEFDPQHEILLVAETEGQVVGFVAARLEDQDELRANSKIPLLYVAQHAQRIGFGLQLLWAAAEWLSQHAPGPVVISAFEQNPFRSLYNSIGGQEAKRIFTKIDGLEWPIMLYLWPSPVALQQGILAKRNS